MRARRLEGTNTQGVILSIAVRLCVVASVVSACTDTGVRPTAVTQSSDSADQVLFKMSTSITSTGVRRSFVEAETAFVYQRNATTDLRTMRLQFYDEQGNLKSTLTADRGTLGTYSNKLDARGHVVVTSPDGRRLRTEHLIYDKQANQILVDTAFVFDSRTEHLSGESATSDIGFNNIDIVKPKGAQKGKGILLPGHQQ